MRSRTFPPILILVFCLLPGVACAQKGASADALGDLEEIAKAYKIEIVTADLRFPVTTTYGAIDGKNADGKELRDYIGLFAPEFALYPQGLVQRSQLKSVVLCGELSFACQRRNAIPD